MINDQQNKKALLVSFTVGVLLCLSLCVYFYSSRTEFAESRNVNRTIQQLTTDGDRAKKPSTAQKQDSQKLKTQLTESQKDLTKAQVYLTDYKQNLMELQKQTDSLNKSVKRMERQRDFAWVVAGGLLIWGCSR